GSVSVVDYNDLYTTGNYLAVWGTVGQIDLTALRTASGKEASSIAVNPSFYSTTNLHTISASLDSAATPIASVTDDFDGQARDPNKPDIGADEFSRTLSFAQDVSTNWNMVSVPLTVNDYRRTAVYPTAISRAFAYTPIGYVPYDTMRNRVGYWVKFPSDQSVSVLGAPRLRDTIPLNTGWNMTGSIDYAIPKASIIQNPLGLIVSNYFTYNPALGYQIVDTVKPGLGYWVKASGVGSIILDVNTTPIIVQSNIEKSSSTLDLHQMNELTFESMSSSHGDVISKARLNFGRGTWENVNRELYVLPPAPPDEAFDIRFTSNRYVELFDDLKDDAEIPVSIQGGSKKMRLSWSIRDYSGPPFVLVERSGGKVMGEHRLTGSGSIVIDGTKKTTYSLQVERIPRTFSLGQNYPNTFNPLTVIHYELPIQAQVSLKIYDVVGQEVATLVDDVQQAGVKSVQWDASNVSSGVYFYRLVAGSFIESKKMILMK
ncbi:MAG: T9SS type A sorting domain-containing protein, partial [Ignavibacteria bacterium]|nr:T9SS type A sorting domain-containing protein [Ignavibacteria bacterium]